MLSPLAVGGVFHKLDPVLHLVGEKNNNKMEQHKEDRLERQVTTKTEETPETGTEQGLIMLNYTGIRRTTSKMKSSQRDENIKSQKLAPREILIILSSGRGGSSFLGAMFDSNPQIMFWFEPLRKEFDKLFEAGVIKQRNKLIQYRQTCVNLIDSFFKCDFSNIANAELSELSRHTE